MIETHIFDDITLLISPIVRQGSESRAEAEQRTVKSMILYALGTEAVLAHHTSGAPYIVGNPVSISISHCQSHACCAFSARRNIGVDIECQRAQLARVAERVFSPDELTEYSSPQLLLRAWTLKEALYKTALTEGLDFRQDIRLPISPDYSFASVGSNDYSVITIIETSDYTLSLTAQPIN